MSRYITLGADELGQVYGIKVNDDGTWKRNSLGLSTSCSVIRPMPKEDYVYATECPESVKEQWQQAVLADQTEKGLDDWFKEIDTEELLDKSFVYELLDDPDNPTVAMWQATHPVSRTFREHVERTLVESADVPSIECGNDVYEWEGAGWFPPSAPFVVKFAPMALLEEYYAHLRETYEEFKG